MSFFSGAVKLIGGKRKTEVPAENECAPPKSDLGLDFSPRDYVKGSFSMPMAEPLSRRILRVIKVISTLTIGLSVGLAAAILGFMIVLRFGSIENDTLSSFLHGRFEKLLPESDLSMKSATLSWNPNVGAMEIVINRLRLDDLSVPKVSILPDYAKSFTQRRLVIKTISLMNPKIYFCVSDDVGDILLNPNFERGGNNKMLLEPLSAFSNLRNLMDDGVIFKLINADVSLGENGVNWKLKNVYCEYKLGDQFPLAVDCTLWNLPGQKYASRVSLSKSEIGSKTIYDVKLESLNPLSVVSAFSRRNTSWDRRIFWAIDGYNLPVSGKLKLTFDGAEFLGGSFDLTGTEGSVKFPRQNALSLNLGKRINGGSIRGSFTKDHGRIDSINVSYGNSELQLTGVDIPLGDFRFLEVANLDGTLSLTNIDVNEMERILPENISRYAAATFRGCLPGFRLETFRVDLNGTIAFGNRMHEEKLNIGHGTFKITGAKIPVEDHFITDVTATGTVSADGLDIRLIGAHFNKTKVNSGTFFLSNEDNSWIGTVNVDVPIDDLSSHLRDISPKLASLPIEKMHIRGLANLNLKLVRLEGDKILNKSFPFGIVEGDGVIKSDNNTKELRLSWNDKKLLASGDVNTGDNGIKLKIEEDLVRHSGNLEFQFVANSEFLTALVPHINKICNGDYQLKISSSWENQLEKYDVSANLKDATVFLPIIGDVKEKSADGSFVAQVTADGDKYEFSKMLFVTANDRISGKMTLDKKGKMLKCSLDEFKIKGNSAKFNILREGDKISLSALGDCLDVQNFFSLCDYADENETISIYVNLKEIIFPKSCKIKNVKGSFDVQNGKIAGGTCYAVIGDDTTLAFTTKDIDKSDGVLLSLSVSNAGKFLKYLKISDTISGGTINFVMKSSKNADRSLSGAFAINDFIVKNNGPLTKLISLSSTNLLPNFDNLTLGFNCCAGNFTVVENQIVIENGRAISPVIGISYRGTYDRMNDVLDIGGISLPTFSILNSQNSFGALAADYKVSGALEMPTISVKPLRFVTADALNETFGSTLPVVVSMTGEMGGVNDGVVPSGNVADPFAQKAFDKKSNESMSSKSAAQKISTDNKFGIKIVRGVKNNGLHGKR